MDDRHGKGGRCPCGSVTFETTASPIFRAYCHCSICREYNGADYADVTVFRAEDIRALDEDGVGFKVYKQPPLVRRGSCLRCGKPAVEKARIPPLPKLVIVPTGNLDDATWRPAPAMHIFYGSRVVDVDDGVRKHDGFASSQLAFGAALIKGLLARR